MLISNIHNRMHKMVSYIQIYVWTISLTKLIYDTSGWILWAKINYEQKIESKREWQWQVYQEFVCS